MSLGASRIKDLETLLTPIPTLVSIAVQPAANVAPVATCDPALAQDPWVFDSLPPSYGPGASNADTIAPHAPRQGELPREYREASPAELDLRIRAAKHALGERVVVLGHFYQRDEVVRHADFVGDSFQLAQATKTRQAAEAIVFCGVHFMAETADMLSGPNQAVLLPNLAAGCSMADMADLDSVQNCWEQLEEVLGTAPDARGTCACDAGDVHELVCRAEGILWGARRDRLHLLKRQHCSALGL